MAINIDMMMPPFYEDQLASAIHGLETLRQRVCGATVRSFVLSNTTPSAEIGR